MTNVWRKERLANTFKSYLKASNKLHIKQKRLEKNLFFLSCNVLKKKKSGSILKSKPSFPLYTTLACAVTCPRLSD